MNARHSAVIAALLAAALFGVSTPLAATLLESLSPFMLAGLFSIGSGVGLAVAILTRSHGRTAGGGQNEGRITVVEIPSLFAACITGGFAAPALLMFGLNSTSAARSALLLNLDVVFSAVIGWIVARKSLNLQIFLGMVAIVLACVVLVWEPGEAGVSQGALLVVLACLAWAVDKSLLRKVKSNNPMLVPCVTGLVGGTISLYIALRLHENLPSTREAIVAMFVGFAGYGVSRVLFAVGVEGLGGAKANKYFSVAPAFGVALSLFLQPEEPSISFRIAVAFMTLGVWLQLRDREERSTRPRISRS
jgi:drug/metabolite transporter (DMT)-like permease